jgi:hypothetical protein
MKRTFALAFAVATVVAAPLLAAPPAKQPQCQTPKAQSRDGKRIELCRRQGIPPIIDPTPIFLASTNSPPLASPDLS